MKIDLGYYLTRSGKVVEVTEKVELSNHFRGLYMFDDNTHRRESTWTWTADGCYLPSKKEYYRDLVKEISIEKHPEYFI